MTCDITIYDPNHVNPYGIELANLLTRNRWKIELWCSRAKTPPKIAIDFSIKPVLPSQRPSKPKLLGWAFGRLVAPIRVSLHARRSVLVIVWTTGVWDSAVFLARILLGGRTIFVYHNPIPGRQRTGFAGLSERVLSCTAKTVVHSEWLKAQLDRRVVRSAVVVHPPYSILRELREAGFAMKSSDRSRSLPRVGYIGGLRADKGADDLGLISQLSVESWDLFYLGPPDESNLARLVRILGGRGVISLPGPGVPSDKDLVHGISSCAVVLAPYRSVTESGSINLAMSLDVPVIAYDSEGIRGLLCEQSRVAGPDALAKALDRFITDPWEAFQVSFRQRFEDASITWSQAIEEA